MRYKRKKKLMPFIGFLVFAVLASFGSSDAFQLKPGDDTTIDCDISFIYGAGWRASGQDRDKLKNANIDDGDRNFEKWDMYNNKGTLLADIDMKFKNTGLFVRPKAFYDHVYMTKNANDSAATNNALKKVPADITKTDDWDDEVKDVHGRNWEILDLFAYTNFDLADKNIEFRVGKQVISWGESLFISGGISYAQSHVDAAASVAVGTEVKEIFLPSESVYLHAELAPSLALSGYYHWKWRKTKLMEGGSFFATSADFLDDLKAPILLGGPFLATRIGDDDPKDSGQFGAALTYVWDWLNATEIGLYYINYHDKAPTVHYANYFSPAPGLVIPKNYYLSYTENIKLYRASFSSLIGDINLSC